MSDAQKWDRLCKLAAKTGRLAVAPDVFDWMLAATNIFGMISPDGVDIISDPDLAPGTMLAMENEE